MKKSLYIITFLILSPSLFSQKEYHKWVFGKGSGLSFNNQNFQPTNLELNNMYGTEGCSSISDSEGNLLFYTNGVTVWNSEHNIMHGGENIGGYLSAARGALIIKKPNSSSIYYIFLNSIEGVFQNPIFPYFGTSYCIVDITKNNGQGEVVSKFNKLQDGTIESITATFHKNKMDIWVIVNSLDSNSVYSFLITENGISDTVVSKISLDNRYYPFSSSISHDNSKIAFCYKFDFLLCDFNSETGVISNQINLNSEDNIGKYSCVFSANSKWLYLSTDIQKIYRYNVSSKDPTLIKNSEKVIDSNSRDRDFWKFQLQLGPDSKIYIANNSRGGKYLHTIEKSNSKDSYVKHNSIPLVNGRSFMGLPNIIIQEYNFIYSNTKYGYCIGDSIKLNARLLIEHNSATYTWEGPNNFESTVQNPLIENANLTHAGLYTVTIVTDTDTYVAEILVRVGTNPTPAISAYPKAFLCEKGEVTLSLIDEHENYLWSTGDTTKFIVVEESGTYGVTVGNELGCTGYAEIQVGFGDEYQLAITGDTIKCEGESVTLTSEEEYPSYRWSNGADTRSITVVEPMKYTLTVTTEDGCEIKRTIEVKDHPNVIAELKPVSTTICEGDSVLLESLNDFPYYSYEWNTGATTRGIYVKETDTYKLTVTDTRTGCMDSTEIAISVEDNLRPTISGMDICAGNPATLEALPNDPSYSYEWSNGETTPTIEVSQPATYTVTVSKDGCSGTADFTVNESPNPEFEIIGEDIVCGNTATLASDQDFAEYLWSTDEITKEIEVTEAGTYSLTVTDENGCSTTKEFTVDEQSLSFDISKDRIDFGKVYISEIAIDSVTIINRSGIELTITDGTQNYTIPDGFPVEYTKTLNPTELGPYTDSFEYRVISPCDTVITVPVTAEVYARVEISTEDIDTEIGKEETIPVYLQAEADLSEQTYTITTEVEQLAFYTEDDYTITHTAEINKAKTKIHEINGMIMLANELEYDITFPSYEFNNPYIEVIDRPGKILIDSICAFPLRSVTFTESTEMKVSPNPARDRLMVDIFIDIPSDIELVEMEDENKASLFDRLSDQRGQQMQVELISSEGRVAYTENWIQTSSEKQLIMNTNKIPSGLYQVRLQTPSGVLTENVIVVR